MCDSAIKQLRNQAGTTAVQGSGGTAGAIMESRAMGAGFGPRRKAARLPEMPLLGLSETPLA